MAKSKRTVAGGGETAKRRGHTGVILYFSPAELAEVRAASLVAGFPARLHWLRKVILDAARKENRKSSP